MTTKFELPEVREITRSELQVAREDARPIASLWFCKNFESGLNGWFNLFNCVSGEIKTVQFTTNDPRFSAKLWFVDEAKQTARLYREDGIWTEGFVEFLG
jgi:hypothetical protein